MLTSCTSLEDRCGTPMTEDTRPVNLDFDLPAQPQSLVKLAALLREDDINLNAISVLIEGDMSFAAAVMKAVNSPLYGLKGRVQSVQQAVTYLGSREISAIAYETGLQAAFPQVPQLIAIWERASIRGLLMGRLAQALSMEAWSAHTAGLFEECGKAVLYRHSPEKYAPMLAAARIADRAGEIACIANLHQGETAVLLMVRAKAAVIRAAPLYRSVINHRHLRRLEKDLA